MVKFTSIMSSPNHGSCMHHAHDILECVLLHTTTNDSLHILIIGGIGYLALL